MLLSFFLFLLPVSLLSQEVMINPNQTYFAFNNHEQARPHPRHRARPPHLRPPPPKDRPHPRPRVENRENRLDPVNNSARSSYEVESYDDYYKENNSNVVINITRTSSSSSSSSESNIYTQSNDDILKLLKDSSAHKTDATKWLFVIAIEDYEFTDSVIYSKNSGKNFEKVMKKRFGIPEKNVRTLLDEDATSAKIEFKLKDMLRRVKENDTVYFYYSGHGIPVPSQNNEPFMLAQDMNPSDMSDNRFKLQNIYKKLDDSKATKVIAFIDSCFSGGTDNQALIKGVAATRIKPKNISINKDKMLIISAGSNLQYSNKYDEKSNRLFTYYIMKGLIKNNTDTQRLYDYVKSNVQERSYEMGSSYEQVPVYSGNIGLKL